MTTTEVTTEKFYFPCKCLQCGYEWMAYHPKNCPGCHTSYWNRPKPQLYSQTCTVCGYTWKSRLKDPPRCANKNCGSVKWKEGIRRPQYHCNICGFNWKGIAKKTPPVKCLRCSSTLWNIPKSRLKGRRTK